MRAMRGKHSNSATVRREAESQSQQIERLERELARNVAALDEAKNSAEYWRQRHARDVRTLKAEVEQATSDELRAAFAAIETMRQQRDTLQSSLDQLRKLRNKEFDWFCGRVTSDLGLTGQEAVELSLGLFGDHAVEESDDLQPPVVHDMPGRKQLKTAKTADGIRRIQAARGDRARPVTTRLGEIALTWRNGTPADIVGPRQSAGVQW